MINYSKSAELLNRAKQVLAGGVSSEFRKYNQPHALFYTHAQGAKIYDVDGNEYLDFTLSQGPMLVGHSNPYVLEKVNAYTAQGQLFAGQHILEIELAEKLQKHIPSAELMRFCLDGSEAVQTALRLSRAKTGRNKFLRFEGHYHGWLDNVAWGISGASAEALGDRENPNVLPWTKGIAEGSDNEFITIPWNDLDLVKKTVEKHYLEIAAIITEPVMCNSGCIPPEGGFLKGLRDICDQYEITLIFDEVITGFRTAIGGAQSHFGVTPDLSIFAKALASGYPISAIVGKKEWVNLMTDGTVIHAGTMNASNPTVAAALATIELLEEPGVYERIYRLGNKLMGGIRILNQKYNQNLLVQGLGPMFHVGFTELEKVKEFRDVLSYDKSKLGVFVAELHDRGVRIIGRGLWYISTVHTDEDINHALNIVEEVFVKMKDK